MSANGKRILVWAVIAVAVVTGVLVALAPRPVMVDLVTADVGPMIVTVDEEAQTRVHDVFVLSAPVAGRVKRIEAHVGDLVTANETILVRIEPGDPTFLDPRSEAQARAAIQAAESARVFAEAEVDQALANLEFAATERRRAKELIREGTITRREADSAERVYKTSRAVVATAQAALQMRIFELEQASAQLLSPAETQARELDCVCVEVTAPVDGRVLKIINRSERVVSPGEPLLELGDATDMEVVADYLSMDAVKIEPGQRVVIDNWGGDTPLTGIVQRIEPFGFTKTSALGIEEQRVNVIIDFTSPAGAWAKLGHGYQVDTRVVLWERDQTLAIPLTALFRDGDAWAAFIDDGGRAVLRQVEIGRRNGLVAEITSGIEPGDRIVLHPSDRVQDGVRITSRG